MVATMAGCPVSDNGEAIKPAPTSRVAMVPVEGEVLAGQLVSLVNAARAEHGVKPVHESPILTQLAEDFCTRMIEGGFFAHVDPETDSSPLKRALAANYLCLAVGENLAAGQTSPAAVLDDWMASAEGHRENILSAQWDEIGASVCTGGEYGVYWVLEFGNRP